MTPPFSVHDDAELELNEAADFYDLENPGLGSSLMPKYVGPNRPIVMLRRMGVAAVRSLCSIQSLRGVTR